VLPLFPAGQADLSFTGKRDQMGGRAIWALKVGKSVSGVPTLHEFPYCVFGPFVVETVPFPEPVIPYRAKLVEERTEDSGIVG